MAKFNPGDEVLFIFKTSKDVDLKILCKIINIEPTIENKAGNDYLFDIFMIGERLLKKPGRKRLYTSFIDETGKLTPGYALKKEFNKDLKDLIND